MLLEVHLWLYATAALSSNRAVLVIAVRLNLVRSLMKLFQRLLGNLLHGHLSAVDVLGGRQDRRPVFKDGKRHFFPLAVGDEV